MSTNFVTMPPMTQTAIVNRSRLLSAGARMTRAEMGMDSLTPLQREVAFLLNQWQLEVLETGMVEFETSLLDDAFRRVQTEQHERLYFWDWTNYINQFTVTPDDIEDIFALLGDDDYYNHRDSEYWVVPQPTDAPSPMMRLALIA